jgi:molybdate transport system substrate-binding protein
MRRAVATVLLAAVALGGCGDDSGSGADAPLTVSAASSLTEAFEAYGGAFPGEEKFSFAGSDELAAQIRQGARPDVFAAANTTLPDELFEEGLLEPPVVFARNRLVVAVPNIETVAPGPVQEVGDLAEPDLDLVIGAAGVPVGDYTRDVLDRLPAAERDAIEANVRSEEPEVKGIVGKLATGAADAGFVYASDVAAAGDELRAIELPARLEPDVAYGAAVVKGAADPDRAQAFVDGLLEGDGAAALAENEFLPPSG